MLNKLLFDFRRMPKINKIFVITIIFSIAVIILLSNIFTFADWVAVRFFPVEARELYTMQGRVADTFIVQTRAGRVSEDDLNYFRQIDEAVDAYFGWEVSQTLHHRDEIKRFTDGRGLLVIYATYRYVNDRLRVSLFFDMFLTDCEMVSYPLYLWAQDIIGCIRHRRRVHFDEDRIARDIMWSFAAEHVTSRVNGGVPIYYGVGVGSHPSYMSILGSQPDVIMPFTHDGNEYFFWYYLNPPLFSETFAEYFTSVEGDGVVRTRTLRLGEIIDVFDIQIIRHANY